MFQFCWTFCMLRTGDIPYSSIRLLGSQSGNVLYIIQSVQHVHHAFKKWQLVGFLVLNLPFNSRGYRIFLLPDQQPPKLPGFCWIHVINSCERLLEGTSRQDQQWDHAAKGSSSHCWIHVLILSRYLETWEQSWSRETLRLSWSKTKISGSTFGWNMKNSLRGVYANCSGKGVVRQYTRLFKALLIGYDDVETGRLNIASEIAAILVPFKSRRNGGSGFGLCWIVLLGVSFLFGFKDWFL